MTPWRALPLDRATERLRAPFLAMRRDLAPPGGGGLRLRFGAERAGLDESPWLGLDIGGAGGAVRLGTAARRALFAGFDAEAPPSDLVGLLVEAQIARALDGAERQHPELGAGGIALGRPLPAVPETWVRVGLDVLRVGTDGPERLSVGLALSPAAAERLAAALTRAAPPVRPGWLRLRAPVLLARGELPRHALTALAPGDGLELPIPTGASEVLVRLGRDRFLRAQRAGSSLSIGGIAMIDHDGDEAQPAMDGETGDAEAGEGTGSAEPSGVFEDLPVRLDFELGSVEFTLAELDGLSEGRVLELHLPADRLVTIRSAGRRIGLGELVDLSGFAAVRVTRLFRDA